MDNIISKDNEKLPFKKNSAKTIAIVDDEPDIIELVSIHLKEWIFSKIIF